MYELQLFSTSWIISDQSILTLADQVANYFIHDLNWRKPNIEEENYYRYISVQPASNGERYKHLGVTDQIKAQKYIQENEISGLRLDLPANWLNPFILSDDVYEPYAIDIIIEKVSEKANLYSVQILMDATNLWFVTDRYRTEIYERYAFVRGYLEKGYSLNTGLTVSPSNGQSYLPDQTKSQHNRSKVIQGLAQFVADFEVLGSTLTYSLPSTANWKRSEFAFRSNEYVPLMYFETDEMKLKMKSLEKYDAAYFEKDFNGVNLHLEDEHFSFLL